MKRPHSHLLPTILCCLFVIATAHLNAASVAFDCAVSDGFNFASDRQDTFGYITSLTIGNSTLRSDLSGKDPTTGSGLQTVAVLSRVNWNGGVSDPLTFVGQISTANKQAVAALSRTATNAQVQINFVVFTYDPIAKKYYKGFGSGATSLKGLVGTSPQFSVSSSPSSDVSSPQNFAMSLAVLPQPVSQTLQFATSATTSVVKRWGVAPQ